MSYILKIRTGLCSKNIEYIYIFFYIFINLLFNSIHVNIRLYIFKITLFPNYQTEYQFYFSYVMYGGRL